MNDKMGEKSSKNVNFCCFLSLLFEYHCVPQVVGTAQYECCLRMYNGCWHGETNSLRFRRFTEYDLLPRWTRVRNNEHRPSHEMIRDFNARP